MQIINHSREILKLKAYGWHSVLISIFLAGKAYTFVSEMGISFRQSDRHERLFHAGESFWKRNEGTLNGSRALSMLQIQDC